MPELLDGWKYVLTLPEGEYVVALTPYTDTLMVATNRRVYVLDTTKHLNSNSALFPVAFAIPPENWEPTSREEEKEQPTGSG